MHEISKMELLCEKHECEECDNIALYDTGDLRSIRLSNYWTSLFTKNSYYDSLIDNLLNRGKRVHALPYDFRKIHKTRYLYNIFQGYKQYIESKKEKTVLICHSLGGLILYEFLKTVDQTWIDKHIEHVFFICVPFAGTVDSLHSVLTNDVNVSKIPLRLKTLRYFGGFYMAFPVGKEPVIRYNDRLFTTDENLFRIFGLNKCDTIRQQFDFDRTKSLGTSATFIISDSVPTKSLIDMDDMDRSILVKGDGLVTNKSLLYPFDHWNNEMNLICVMDSDHGKICGHKKTISSILEY
jgi:hypothetical protein